MMLYITNCGIVSDFLEAFPLFDTSLERERKGGKKRGSNHDVFLIFYSQRLST